MDSERHLCATPKVCAIKPKDFWECYYCRATWEMVAYVRTVENGYGRYVVRWRWLSPQQTED